MEKDERSETEASDTEDEDIPQQNAADEGTSTCDVPLNCPVYRHCCSIKPKLLKAILSSRRIITYYKLPSLHDDYDDSWFV